MTDNIDKRPGLCRFRLEAEGKPYPKSGCEACGIGVFGGCPHDRPSEPDIMDEARSYQGERSPDMVLREEPFYSGAQLRAAYRHGYDFAIAKWRDRYTKLFDAARALYRAAHWTADRPCGAERLWTDLRDAVELAPGSAPPPLELEGGLPALIQHACSLAMGFGVTGRLDLRRDYQIARLAATAAARKVDATPWTKELVQQRIEAGWKIVQETDGQFGAPVPDWFVQAFEAALMPEAADA